MNALDDCPGLLKSDTDLSEDEAEEMLDAVRDKPDGVLRWIMRLCLI